MFMFNLFRSGGASTPGEARPARRGRAAFAACLMLVTMVGAAPAAEAPPVETEPGAAATVASTVAAVQTCDAIQDAADMTCVAADMAATAAETPAQRNQAAELGRICHQLIFQVFVCAFF